MRTTALITALTVALASLTPPARPAHACGSYGGRFALRSPAERTVDSLIDTVRARNADAALALLTSDAEWSPEYNGCCMPPTHAAAPWLRQQLSRGSFSIGTLRETTLSADGNVSTAQLRGGRVAGVATNVTLELAASADGLWRVRKIYTARATRST